MNPVDNSIPKVTAADVLAFMREKADELSSKVPGYVIVEVNTTAGGGNPQNSFRAYVEHIGWSATTNDPALAIAELSGKTSGKSQAQILRERAAELSAQADSLENGGSQ